VVGTNTIFHLKIVSFHIKKIESPSL